MSDRGIYKKPNSPYWWIRYSAHGRYFRKSTGTTSLREARAILNEERAFSRSTALEGRVTYDQMRALLAEDYERNERDIYHLTKSHLPHLDRAFRGVRASTIRGAELSGYISARLAEGAAPATINRELSALRRMFNLAVKLDLLTAGTPPKFQLLQEHNRRKGFFEADQLTAICSHLPGYLVPVVHVAAITGWRVRSELLTRQLKHVDLRAGWLRLDPGETKNGEGREFPLKGVLREIIKAQLAETRAFERSKGRVVRWLFHRNGHQIRGFRKAWRTACLLSGQQGKMVHDFRRTAVRAMERAGIGRSAAMSLVGHKTESIYRRYAIVDAKVLQEAGSKLLEQHTHGTPGADMLADPWEKRK